MYYLSRTSEVVVDLPSYYKKCSDEELAFRGVLPFVDEGESVEKPVKSEIVESGREFIQLYISIEAFSLKKKKRISMLRNTYETKIDKVVRKSTQDLAFGDIQEIPKKVVAQRERYKVEYHEKVAAINAAQNVPELNAIPM